MSAEKMLFIGTCTGCNQLVAGAVDDARDKKETAKFVAQMIRDGLRVERISVNDARNRMGHCTCEPNPRKRKTKAAVAQPLLPLGAT